MAVPPSQSKGDATEMDSEMVWIDEGSVLDDAGNLIMTTYIDLREEGDRTPIPAG